MPATIDHVADKNGVEFARLARLYDIPDFVKKADFQKTFSDKPVAKQHYADPLHNQFPCDTRARTFLSCVYFTEKRAEFKDKEAQRIQNCLDRYIEYWGIKKAVDDFLVKHNEYNKEAQAKLPDSCFAYVWVDQDTGHKERRLSLRNANEVKVAADWLVAHHTKMAFEDAHVIASKILEKAADYGANVTMHMEFLEKKAGRGVCDPRKVVSAIKTRALLCKKAQDRAQILKLADYVEGTPRKAMGPGMLVELAKTLDVIDRAQNLTSKYGSDLDRPEDVVFEATFTKAASELSGLVATTSGKVYKKDQLAKIGLDTLRDVFGDEFASEVKSGSSVDLEKLAEVVHTLPRPDAETFDKLMSQHGVAPTMKKSASVRQGFSKSDFERMAADYAA